MRRFYLLVLLIGVVLGVAAGTASTTATTSTTAATGTAVTLPQTTLANAAPDFPFAINAASDSCETATLAPFLPWGDQTLSVNLLSESNTDPVLSCMWGSPARPQGYRTAWYKFEAPYSAQVTIDTFYSDYDTVLAVYSGSCGAENLVQLACSDDHQGFTSQVSLFVRRGEIYYVEVADWHQAVYGSTLSLTILINPVDSYWERQANMPIPRSRHSVVAQGNYLYVIGGETLMGANPDFVSALQRLDTNTGAWVTLDPMPGVGYANSTAALVNGKIYLPSGFVGGGPTSAYDGTHHVYDIASGAWSLGATAPWPGGRPLAWGTAVVPPTGGSFPPFPGYFYTGGTPDQPPFEAHANSSNPAIPSASVLFYNADGNNWPTTLIPSLSVPRFAHTAAWVQGRLCVVSGLGLNDGGTQNILLTDGECYRPGVGWQSIGGLNYPRFNAGSAVGLDGRWYVFGGLDGTSEPVDVTEYYDAATNTWRALSINYALGGIPENPARAWPRGAFVGNTLWVMGGNGDGPVGSVYPMVEKLPLPTPSLFIPILFKQMGTPPNDTLGTAWGLALNQPQFHTFDSASDFYDTYFFDLGTTRTVTVRLSDIPSTDTSASNYDLFLYNQNKVLRGESRNLSNQPEAITLTLTPGRYYVVVERVFTSSLDGHDTSPYRIIVEGS